MQQYSIDDILDFVAVCQSIDWDCSAAQQHGGIIEDMCVSNAVARLERLGIEPPPLELNPDS